MQRTVKSSLRRSQDGMVIAWAAVMLVIFLLMAAFAVDLGFWYYRKHDIQRAADAAASAAVVVRASDRGTALADALVIARDIAAANGYANGGTVSVTGSTFDSSGHPLPSNQYRVIVYKDSPNFFLSIIGMSKQRIVAESTAQFTAPVQLGSPSNVYGREFDPAGSWNTSALPPPQLWVSIAGRATQTTTGDQYSASLCNYSATGPTAENAPDNCPNAPNPSNLDYVAGGSDGYDIIVKTEGTAPSDHLDIQLYDPAFAEQGMGCLFGPSYELGRYAGTQAADKPWYAVPASVTTSTSPPLNCAGDTAITPCHGGWEDCGGGGGGGGGFSTLRNSTTKELDERNLEPTDAGGGAGCLGGCPVPGNPRPNTRFQLYPPTNSPNVVDLSGTPLIEDTFGFYWQSYAADQYDADGSHQCGIWYEIIFGIWFPVHNAAQCFGSPSYLGGNSLDGLIANYNLNTLDVIGDFGIECAGNKFDIWGASVRCPWVTTDPNGGFYLNRNDILDTPDDKSGWTSSSPGHTLMNSSYANVGRLGSHRFRDTYHKWVNFASVTNLKNGYYVLHVSTAPQYPGALESRGANNFSVRARVIGSAGAKVSVFPFQKMAVQANVTGTVDQYVAKAPTGISPNKNLNITMFDLADIAECSSSAFGVNYPDPKTCHRAPNALAGTLQLGRYTAGGVFTPLPTCSMAIGRNNNTFLPAPACQLALNSTLLSSRLLKIQIPLGSFTCTGDECWIVGRFTYPTTSPGGAILPSDTTTWTAKIDGDPVSIVN